MDVSSVSRPEATGAESALVGLSPSYWSNIPMSIADVHQIRVVDGLNCIVRHSPGIQFFPVSRCTLVGMIVFASEEKDILKYILDDGTGWIDCSAWAENEESIHVVPRLGKQYNGAAGKSKYKVGDRVRIRGTIHCINVTRTSEEIDTGGTQMVEIRGGIHEIKVFSMDRLTPFETECDLHYEAHHWATSILATRPATGENTLGLRNALKSLEWLGPKIAKDVRNRENLPSSSDSLGAWKVFGVACTCKLQYKQDLLYCHCQATMEPLDPDFTFRDALLKRLLLMEREHHKSKQQQQQNDNPQLDLRFQYNAIANDPELYKIAEQVATNTDNPEQIAHHLIRSTFLALKQDGILCLLDEESDTYVLLSRKSVLEPYIRRKRMKRKKRRRTPCYLQDVPWARLQYVERCCCQHVLR